MQLGKIYRQREWINFVLSTYVVPFNASAPFTIDTHMLKMIGY